jgi:glycosyltransferase involved in cell wall biosynthesis
VRVCVNALPIHPGGGLTVIRGLLGSLVRAAPDWDITVVASHGPTLEALRQDGCVTVIPLLQGRSAGVQLVWQNTRFGGWLRDRGAELCLTVNHHLANLSCPQVVYHLNLLRFPEQPRRGWTPGQLAERLRDRLARRALAQAEANVFESRFLADRAGRIRTPAHPHVIHVGLPEPLLAEARATATALGRPAARAAAASPPSTRRLVAITNARDHKDNPTLLRTLAELVRRRPDVDWRLDVAGGVRPEMWRPVQALAADLGVGDRITWHGFCDSEALSRLLAAGLCLVSTSRVESFCMVALESMARGCPAIVADAAAMPESVGEAALLAAPGDPSSFATAVLSLADDPDLRARLVTAGLAWVDRFRWERTAAEFVAVGRQVVATGPARRNR